MAEGVTLCAVFLIHWGIKTVSRWLGMESDLSTVWILQAFGYIRAVTVIGVGVFEGLAVIWSAGRAFVQTVRGSGNKVS